MDWFDSLLVLGAPPAGESHAVYQALRARLPEVLVRAAGAPAQPGAVAPGAYAAHTDAVEITLAADLLEAEPALQKAAIVQQLRDRGYRRPFVWLSDEALGPVYLRFNEAFRAVALDGLTETWRERALALVDLATAPAALARGLAAKAGVRCDVVADDAGADALMNVVRRRVEQRLGRRKRVLILYDQYAGHTATVREYLESFRRYSENDIYYAIGVNDAPPAFDLDLFDAVVLHYSVRLSLEQHMPEHLARQVAAFMGPKLLFIQDEYDTTGTAKRWMRRLGVDVVFTCVPEPFQRAVYPEAELPGVKLVTVLTGGVPEELKHVRAWRDLGDRTVVVGYRGRELPYWYGKLGREKLEIGIGMKAQCQARGVAHDIEWTDDKRIYGTGWFDFMQSCRAFLGTESGANVFDEDGGIRRNIEAAVAANPKVTFDELHARFMTHEEGRVLMNQISPKVFEAIAFRTALVLFEGEYSGVVKPWDHFIPLKKDFSNADEVFAKLNDLEFLRAMTERAYRDVIASGKYDYDMFVRRFDEELRALPALTSPARLVPAFVAVEEGALMRALPWFGSAKFFPSTAVFDYRSYQNEPTGPAVEVDIREMLRRVRFKTLLRQVIVRAWLKLPPGVRKLIKPVLLPGRALLRLVWK